MIAFHTLCPEVAQREIRNLTTNAPISTVPAGEYAFMEFYCEDLKCDCRRGFIQVIGRAQGGEVLASINYGWESLAFYQKTMPYDPKAPRAITEGSLDPLNKQSPYAGDLLKLFQTHVATPEYRERLKRHHDLFRAALRQKGKRAKGK